jgi:uncharacterized protein DUF4124
MDWRQDQAFERTRFAGAGESLMKRKLLLLVLVSTVATAYATPGQVYKWTDAGGVVHYSDSPPPKDATSAQTVRVTGGDRPHAIPTENVDPAAKPADPNADKPPGPNVAMDDTPDNRVKACDSARSNLTLLQGKGAVAVNGADGKPQTLDDKGRQAQIADANAQIALYCK